MVCFETSLFIYLFLFSNYLTITGPFSHKLLSVSLLSLRCSVYCICRSEKMLTGRKNCAVSISLVLLFLLVLFSVWFLVLTEGATCHGPCPQRLLLCVHLLYFLSFLSRSKPGLLPSHSLLDISSSLEGFLPTMAAISAVSPAGLQLSFTSRCFSRPWMASLPQLPECGFSRVFSPAFQDLSLPGLS